MTPPRVSLGNVLRVTAIVAGCATPIGASIGAYIAVRSEMGAIIARLDEHSRSMDEYRREAVAFREQLVQLRLSDSRFATADRLGVVEQRVEGHEVRLRAVEKRKD